MKTRTKEGEEEFTTSKNKADNTERDARDIAEQVQSSSETNNTADAKTLGDASTSSVDKNTGLDNRDSNDMQICTEGITVDHLTHSKGKETDSKNTSVEINSYDMDIGSADKANSQNNIGLETNKSSDIVDMCSDNNSCVGLENKAGSEIDPMCEMCTLEWHDPKPEDLVMYLHAYRYQGPDWEFSTPLPHWANLPDADREGNQS